MRQTHWRKALFVALALVTAGCRSEPEAGPDPASMTVPQIVDAMSVERKVGQLIMPDIASITPEDVRAYRFGAILNGGNSGPGGDDLAPAEDWLELADAVWDASTAPLGADEPSIPTLWATDAVHGHSNLGAATIFPHNIGLGATRNPDLVRQIGAVTAAEIAVTGIDWTFAPTLAVATDDRWGRTYESFSEDHELVSQLGEAQILGLQGDPQSDNFLSESHVLATAKHFYGDGGTRGLDRGDTRGDAEELKRIHGAPYGPAIAADVQTVMASFSSVNGEKIHGSRAILTGYLREELGFEGLVVGDWNGHGELESCTNSDCSDSLLAGLDMYMVPEDWKALYENLLDQVNDGTIPMARLDEAVTRILNVKQAMGLFDSPRPSERALAGNFALLGSPEHRDVAREAVRQSLVLLTNNGVLPIASGANVLVAGEAGDSIALQSGGWSITWQGGGDLTNDDFTGATSIYAGMAEAIAAGGGTAAYSQDGNFDAKPDVAIVVFGEEPYAEFVGDITDLAFRDTEGLELLRLFDAQNIPTVAVFLSGRPLWMNREMALADAFVAAWLPGSEGAGVADVLIGNDDGTMRHDFAGKLSFGWPAGCSPDAAALFPFGAGLTYSDRRAAPQLDQNCSLLDANRAGQLRIFGRGLNREVAVTAQDANGTSDLPNLTGQSSDGALLAAAFDLAAQEDARELDWQDDAALTFTLPANYQADPAASLVLRYRLDDVPEGAVALSAQCEACGEGISLRSTFVLAAGKDWRTAHIPLRCLADSSATAFSIEAEAGLKLSLAEISLTPESFEADCAGPF